MDVYIVGGCRTPIGNFAGALNSLSAVQLGTHVTKSILTRCQMSPNLVDEVIFGQVLQSGCGQNTARQILIAAGIPNTSCAQTINMVCGSGLKSVVAAAQSILCKDANIVVAGGSESMSNSPYILRKARFGVRMGHDQLLDSILSDGLTDAFSDIHMGITAENIAQKFAIGRSEQDLFACQSQNKAEMAIKSDKFVKEITTLSIPVKKTDAQLISQDEYPRFGLNVDSLNKLRPAFKEDGTVTAGNASGINDGAAVVLLASQAYVSRLNLKPLARLVSWAWSGLDPSLMGMGPVEATRKVIDKAGWKIADLDLVEANEAFAVQALAVIKELRLDPNIVNVNGGAIALGHPIGASGTRILVTLLHEMERRDVKRGLATLCIGGGMGIAVCVER